MNLEYWFDFMEGWTTEEIVFSIGLFVVVGFLALLTTPYSSSFMKAKRNAIIEDEYRKRFKK
ncbi:MULTISPECIES: hypothetical protein [unclassified Streptococcus]|uniref:hypothetical protein n=1 Tax=unclassified Streptococcus TaxID=2608887 RepID=UPI0018CBCD21|nr:MULTISPECIES: hypothetical protein [unclassified Streptococcus]MBG9367007.1 hypothetical protein [Streptococcus sp. NLN64]MBJ6745633.1 hypothetical protein [Streptococcus sp. 121]